MKFEGVKSGATFYTFTNVRTAHSNAESKDMYRRLVLLFFWKVSRTALELPKDTIFFETKLLFSCKRIFCTFKALEMTESLHRLVLRSLFWPQTIVLYNNQKFVEYFKAYTQKLQACMTECLSYDPSNGHRLQQALVFLTTDAYLKKASISTRVLFLKEGICQYFCFFFLA